MTKKIKIVSFLAIVLLAACSAKEVTEVPTQEATQAPKQEETPVAEPTTAYPVEKETEEPESGYPVETETQEQETAYPVATETQVPDLTAVAEGVIRALAQKDMAALAEYVHPEMGVRFSPYAFVREEHQVFMPGDLPGLVGSDQVYTWGAYDGTGEPIDLTFDAYYEEFVYSSDFANPEATAVDERIGQGNSINNIGEFYPGSSFVEYHFSGFDAQYEGMDWESLRLVFVQEDAAWWLVGVVHDEWTI